MRHCILGLFLAACACGAAPPAAGCDLAFNFSLTPEQVVPPSSSTGSGVADLSLCFDLRGVIRLDLTDVVTSVHVHGPAAPGENGPVLFPLPLPVEGLVHVSIQIPLEIVSLLATNAAYVDVHTAAHPDGAIRGVFRWEGGTGVTPSSWTVVKALFR